MIQRYKGALACATWEFVTKSRLVGRACKLGPVSMYDLRKGPQEWICDVVQERWVDVEVTQLSGLKFEALSRKVVFNEGNDVALCDIRKIEGGKVRQDLLGRLDGGLVDKCLGIGEDLCNIDGLEQLVKQRMSEDGDVL